MYSTEHLQLNFVLEINYFASTSTKNPPNHYRPFCKM